MFHSFEQRIIKILFVLCFVINSKKNFVTAQKNPYFYEGRSVIVQLFEWKYTDIARDCETFLGPNGFGAVQVAPVTENAILPGRPWHERYQPVSYIIVTRSGNEEEFMDMVKRCNVAKIRVYVEVVLNHMAAGEEIFGTGGSIADGEMLMYPGVKYNASDFNVPCEIESYSNAEEIRRCRLLGMPDLNQEHEFVQNAQTNLLNKLISYGVAGFFVSDAGYMFPQHLAQIFDKLTDLNTKFGFSSKSRAFVMLEVIDFGKGAINRNEYIPLGVVTEYRYARDIGTAFQADRTLHSLLGLGPKHGYLPPNEALVFLHTLNTKRLNNNELLNIYKNDVRYQMALAFMLAHPYGIPTILSSYHFKSFDQGPPSDEKQNIISPKFDSNAQCTNGWTCEHRWPVIRHMIKFRIIVGNGSVNNWADNGRNQAGFCRGNNGFIAFNNEENGKFKTTIPVCVPTGMYFDVFTGNIEETRGTKMFEVDNRRKAKIEILDDDKYRMIAFHTNSLVIQAAENDENDFQVNVKEIQEEIDEIEEILEDIEEEIEN